MAQDALELQQQALRMVGRFLDHRDPAVFRAQPQHSGSADFGVPAEIRVGEQRLGREVEPRRRHDTALPHR
jgi:hypothetical protein